MDDELMRQTQKARDTHPQRLKPCEVWGRGNFLHICFSSVGCRFRSAGYCTMCDYGGGDNVSLEEALTELRQALEQASEPVEELLLGTCGSILDKREMSRPVLQGILEAINSTSVQSVILETHYTTITDNILNQIQTCLINREIVIELGFESANPKVLERSLNKFMDLEALSATMKQIAAHGMHTVLNVFLGAPFLTVREQLEDAQNAIAWAAAHGASRVVVFPANIKPNTLLEKLYNSNQYARISHWLLVELLDSLDDSLLEIVELAWYGDRQHSGRNLQIIPPASCPQCDSLLMKFYQDFMTSFQPTYRKNLLKNIIRQSTCACYQELKRQLSS